MNETMSGHLAALRAAEAHADETHAPGSPGWKDARRNSRRDHLAALVGEVEPEAERYLDWLAGWDAETVAGVAALIDAARR